MRVVIEGIELPGTRCWRADGAVLDAVHVGVQVRAEPCELVPGDAASARWELDVTVAVGPDGEIDFKGPAVQGRRGDRFLYLTWGNVGSDGEFTMFRRAKLMLDRVEPDLVRTAESSGSALVATIRLTDDNGGPRCARVDPPDLRWSSG